MLYYRTSVWGSMLLAPFNVFLFAPCSFQHSHNNLTFFAISVAPFSFSYAPFCFLLFISCSRIFSLAPFFHAEFTSAPCSLLEYFVLPANGLGLSFHWFLLLHFLGLAPCQIGHAPCSRIIPNRGPLLLTEKANIKIYVVEIHENNLASYIDLWN